MKHGVGRNGKKLFTALIEQMSKEDKSKPSGLISNEKDKNLDSISRNQEDSGSDQSEGKTEDENNSSNTNDTGDVSN